MVFAGATRPLIAAYSAFSLINEANRHGYVHPYVAEYPCAYADSRPPTMGLKAGRKRLSVYTAW
jgi:hypothetical protein